VQDYLNGCAIRQNYLKTEIKKIDARGRATQKFGMYEKQILKIAGCFARNATEENRESRKVISIQFCPRRFFINVGKIILFKNSISNFS
jgi:hypothetical protein